MKLIVHLHVAMNLRMHGALLALTHAHIRFVQGGDNNHELLHLNMNAQRRRTTKLVSSLL